MNKFSLISAIVIATVSGTVSAYATVPEKDSKARIPFPAETFMDGQLKIWCVNHGSLAMDWKGYGILIDPVTEYKGQAFDYGCFGKNELILVTHGHSDHLCPGAIEEQTAKNSVRVILNRSSQEKLGYGEVMDNGDTMSVAIGQDVLRITAVPAYNTTESHLKFHPKGDGNGYILDFNGFRVYVAGDTEDIEEMRDFGHIDVAFLPVNQPFTMTPAQCIEAAGSIKPSVLIPYHTGDTGLTPITDALQSSSITVRTHEELR